MEKLKRYIAACDEPPEENRIWKLYGAGLEHLGKDGHSEQQSMYQPAADEILVRVDASGICASDFKVMNLGSAHRLLQGRDLAKEPLVLGHEVAVTVVETGADYAAKYHKGQRFAVLPGIYYKTELYSIGYILDGGFQQYMLLGKEILEGDDGVYLAPLRDTDGYCEAAMIEPWSCVVAAYRIAPRSTLRPGGSTWFVGFSTQQAYTDLRRIFQEEHPPARVFASDVPAALERELQELCMALQVDFYQVDKEMLMESAGNYASECFDDILCLGLPDTAFINAFTTCRRLANHGIFCVMSEEGKKAPARFNAQRPHYDDMFILGAETGSFADGYAIRESGSGLLPSGSAVIVGAGGPMGRMHVQLAVGAKHGPKLLVVCDPDKARVASLVRRYEESMRREGRSIVAVNPGDFAGEEALRAELLRINQGAGYSDIVICAPVGSLVAQWFPLLAEEGILNVFAGILKGYEVEMDISALWRQRKRILGSCGVKYDDFFYTLRMMQEGQLDTDSAVAAVAGMDAAREGLELVMKGAFLGKTVIYPALEKLPLMTLEGLSERYPGVRDAMKEGKYWCREAEKALFEACLAEGE